MAESPDRERFNILIVDDVPKNIQVAANVLQKEDYRMFFAQSEPGNGSRFTLVLPKKPGASV